MSVRVQPLEPSILSSKVQMKRMSSFGSKPAVAPQVSRRPPTFRHLQRLHPGVAAGVVHHHVDARSVPAPRRVGLP